MCAQGAHLERLSSFTHNASPLPMLFSIMLLWVQQKMRPYRTFLFRVYSFSKTKEIKNGYQKGPAYILWHESQIMLCTFQQIYRTWNRYALHPSCHPYRKESNNRECTQMEKIIFIIVHQFLNSVPNIVFLDLEHCILTKSYPKIQRTAATIIALLPLSCSILVTPEA